MSASILIEVPNCATVHIVKPTPRQAELHWERPRIRSAACRKQL